MSLKSRIRQAQTPAEVQTLLEEGKGYEHASHGTIEAWRRVAARRIEELLAPPPATSQTKLSKAERKARRHLPVPA